MSAARARAPRAIRRRKRTAEGRRTRRSDGGREAAGRRGPKGPRRAAKKRSQVRTERLARRPRGIADAPAHSRSRKRRRKHLRSAPQLAAPPPLPPCLSAFFSGPLRAASSGRPISGRLRSPRTPPLRGSFSSSAVRCGPPLVTPIVGALASNLARAPFHSNPLESGFVVALVQRPELAGTAAPALRV